MTTEACKHGSEIDSKILINLHENQGGTGRHRCPTCAYQLGYTIGGSKRFNSYSEFISSEQGEIEECPEGTIVPKDYLLITGDNQGGAGRHKCCNCAFKIGFEDALNTKQKLEQTVEITLNLKTKPSIKKIVPTKSTIKEYKGFDYEASNNMKKFIGDIGEELILLYEQSLPHNRNSKNRIRHIAKEIGDGPGYDILSFDPDGTPRYIEVKTTTSGKRSPFFISINERNFLTNNDNTYIYRVYDLSLDNKQVSFFILSKEDIVQLNYQAQIFKVIFE